MDLDPNYQRFYNEFLDDEDMCSKFGIPDLGGYEVLYAIYDDSSWNGEAWGLLEKNQKLFVFEANHCSCYALDGLFDPVLTSSEAIKRERWTKLDPQIVHRDLINAILDDFDNRFNNGK